MATKLVRLCSKSGSASARSQKSAGHSMVKVPAASDTGRLPLSGPANSGWPSRSAAWAISGQRCCSSGNNVCGMIRCGVATDIVRKVETGAGSLTRLIIFCAEVGNARNAAGCAVGNGAADCCAMTTASGRVDGTTTIGPADAGELLEVVIACWAGGRRSSDGPGPTWGGRRFPLARVLVVQCGGVIRRCRAHRLSEQYAPPRVPIADVDQRHDAALAGWPPKSAPCA